MVHDAKVWCHGFPDGFSCLDFRLSPPQPPEAEVPDVMVKPPRPLVKRMEGSEAWSLPLYYSVQRDAGLGKLTEELV